MEDKSSNFNKRTTIEKPSLNEVGYERLRAAKKKIKWLEKKIYGEVDEYIEQRVKPHTDITYAEKEKLKERLAENLINQLLKPAKEEVKAYEESLEKTIGKEGRVKRKLEEVEREVKDIAGFELERLSEQALRDISSEKEEDKKA